MTGGETVAGGGQIANRIIFALGLLVCAAALLPVLANDLIWDDEFLILQAEGLGDPDRLWDMLTVPFWQNSNFVAALLHDYWRPVTTFVIWLGAFAWGTWAPGFHLISLLGAAGAAFACYALVRRVTGDESRWIARWLALIFLVHPLAAEVICLSANVSDHLCFTFLALSVLSFHQELARGSACWRLPLAAIFALLACGSKELGVAAAAAPLAAWLLLRARDPQLPTRRLLRPQIWAASLVPVAAYLAARYAVTSSAGHVETHFPDPGYYVWTSFLGLGQALRQIVVPIPGGAYTYIEGNTALPIALAALAWLAVAFAIAWSIVRARGWRLPLVGLLLALALLLPSLLSADRFGAAVRFPTRYFHLPLAGALIAAVPFAIRTWQRALRYAAPLLVGLLALLSWMRIDEWRDSVSFFHSETIYHPQSAPDLLNLVRAMNNMRAYNEAEKVLDRIDGLPSSRDPSFRAKLLNDRATIRLLRDGDVEGASELLHRALALEPSNLANVLDLAAMRMTAGKPDQAVIVLEKALAAPWFKDYRRQAIKERLARYKEIAAGDKDGASGAEK
jgi:tetratricopeptide (TPR) repeat protein